ncbi:hypothetical protein PPSIR1_12938 [Plesiocystis pacifica SIR-1]|uniref:VWFA domain-containing protein n=1 Tax=Plesiocystis pacifica SIR-1 TaxID=391625 RepID=A6G092_9BACT|nr:hypothetical protein [Plesiocystis pacifica]EDM80789.1 hypothetical protein PPSIR1_12938 [Plesiocystis pacifica SIR-1]
MNTSTLCRSLTAIPLLLLLPAFGCGDDGGSNIYDSSNQTGMTVGNEVGEDEADDGATEEDDDDDDADDGMTKLDTLGEDEGQASADDGSLGNGCQKVDFLFVIDNSGSMFEEQDNLAGSFPSFINSISATLDEAQDYHVMVIDTDAWVHGDCEILCGFPIPVPGLCEGYECGVTQPEECEDVLGAGVTHPKGAQASNVDCNFANGLRFMTDAEPNLPATFQCAARVGTGSSQSPEKPMEAMVAALSSNGPVNECNQGFLRDDAILVVTFITDEDDDADDGSAGTVDGWRAALIAAKGGDASSIVVLGLFGDGDQPNPICGTFGDNSGAETSPRLRQFIDSWGDQGFFGSICADDYDEFFQDAVDIIDTTCDEFTPPE